MPHCVINKNNAKKLKKYKKRKISEVTITVEKPLTKF